MMIFTFLSQPCHTEPTVARAYCALRKFWRFIHDHPLMLDRLRAMFSFSINKQHSLLRHISQACETFHLRLFPDMQIGIGKHKYPILDVCARDLCNFLRIMGRQNAYERVSFRTRKDIMRPTGLLDFPLSTVFLKKYKAVPNETNLVPHLNRKLLVVP